MNTHDLPYRPKPQPANDAHGAAPWLRRLVEGLSSKRLRFNAGPPKVGFVVDSGVPRNFVRGGSTNLVEDRGQKERGSGAIAPYSGVLEAAVIWYNKFHFI